MPPGIGWPRDDFRRRNHDAACPGILDEWAATGSVSRRTRAAGVKFLGAQAHGTAGSHHRRAIAVTGLTVQGWRGRGLTRRSAGATLVVARFSQTQGVRKGRPRENDGYMTVTIFRRYIRGIGVT